MNPGCEKCKHKDMNPHKEPCVNCWVFDERPNFEQRSTTNADSIRGMSDEELAHFMARVCPPGGKCNEDGNCFACRRDWLKSPVEVSDGQNAD